jgi:hypothetical protein
VTSTRNRALDYLVLLLVIGLVGANIVLLRQNHRLKTEPPLPSALTVHSDQPLRDLGGVGFDGKFHVIALPQNSSDHLLVFTFAPRCPECQLGEPFVDSLSAQAKKLGWRTIWVSRGDIDETKSYCEAHNIPLDETFVEPPYTTYYRLGLAAVPQLVAIGVNGQVEAVWGGRLTVETARAASQFLADRSKSPPSAKPVPST